MFGFRQKSKLIPQVEIPSGEGFPVLIMNGVGHDPEESSAPHDYWNLARQPLYSFLFLAPILFALDWLVFQQPSAENPLATSGIESRGVEQWFRQILRSVDLDLPFVLPGGVALLLLGWQLYGQVQKRYRLTLRLYVLIGMAAECLLFCGVMIVIGQLQDLIFQELIYRPTLAAGIESGEVSGVNFQGRTIGLIGAGIYEEVLFRLMLLPLLTGGLRLLTLSWGTATFFAVCLTSAAFACVHQFGPHSDPILSLTFTFRLTAGLFLSVLFLWRGFGVTVGSHAAYNVVVGAIMQSRL